MNLIDYKKEHGIEVAIFYPGFGDAWALYVSDIGKYHFDPKIAKASFHKMIADNKLVRCQAAVRADYDEGAKYVEWLGFEFEARLRRYLHDGTDALMYVIIDGRPAK